VEESPFVDELIVSDSSAAFDGPYGEKPRSRIVAWFIEMLMMLPRPARRSGCGVAARAIRNGT
jgi:hypothetical protein